MLQHPNFIVTIGRQFGSGGREIGKLIANKLSIQYFDKELLAEAAKDSGVNASFFERSDERSPTFFDTAFHYNLGSTFASYLTTTSPLSPDSIYAMQSRVIERIANEQSCVIVGRTADYVLRHHKECISIFLHASLEARVARIMARKDSLTAEDAKAFAKKQDKLRAGYYNYYTDKTWGAAASYDLSIDTSHFSAEEVADIIVDYVKKRIARAHC